MVLEYGLYSSPKTSIIPRETQFNGTVIGNIKSLEEGKNVKSKFWSIFDKFLVQDFNQNYVQSLQVW
jgi:hypothetical protein